MSEVLPPETERLGREADHSFISISKIYEYSYTSLPPYTFMAFPIDNYTVA